MHTAPRSLITATVALVLAAAVTAPAGAQATTPPAAAGQSPKQAIGRPTATLTPAIRVGNLLFLSGQLPGGGDSTIQAQTTRTLNNIKTILDQAGARVEDVVKCTVFLINNADFRGMNEAYGQFFAPGPPPARSTVVVAALVSAGAKLEIECIAAMR
jgi:2-iminobutanoate/2-iminopropanoate deaminase